MIKLWGRVNSINVESTLDLEEVGAPYTRSDGIDAKGNHSTELLAANLTRVYRQLTTRDSYFGNLTPLFDTLAISTVSAPFIPRTCASEQNRTVDGVATNEYFASTGLTFSWPHS